VDGNGISVGAVAKRGEKRILNGNNESKKGGCNEERNMKVKSGEKIERLSRKHNIQERHIRSWGMKAMQERIALSSK